MVTTCNICCENLNKSNRKDISCVFCNFVSCRTCFQKYISETSEDPHCMNCKKQFNNSFINDCCTNIFINTVLKKHRQNVLFDREKAMLPETQPYVVLEIKRKQCFSEIRKLEDQKVELNLNLLKLNNQINRIYTNMNQLTVNNFTDEGSSSSAEERKKFIRKCPILDCRGFLSTHWKCVSCETQICKRCNEEKKKDELDNEGYHNCIPENVASMELLNKDTKPCPSCGTMIFRISGCPMMFCVDCHTPWNWNSGLIETGTIHNPHYYEFIRNGGNTSRNVGDIPCGGLPDVYHLRIVLNKFSFNTEITKNLYSIHQCIIHIERVEITRNDADPITLNRNLRVNYLMNVLSEDSFKSQLQLSERTRNKRTDFNNIFQMFVNVASDIFAQIYQELNKVYSVTQIELDFLNNNYTILVNLTNYFNENIKKIGKMYNCVYPGFTEKFNYIGNLEKYKNKIT